MSELQRYGLEWKSKKDFVCHPMADGYWTPWHIATEEITRLQSEVERLRGLAESEIMGFMSVAVEICRQEADEWDSDRLQTFKNYAEVCGQRIERLMPGSAKAHILGKQADAVEAAIEWLHNQYPKLDGPHLGLLTTRVQRLRQQAAESESGTITRKAD